MTIKNTVMMGAMFVAGVALVGGSFAYMGNEEVQTAIETNDYTAFVEVAGEKLLEKVDSPEAFATFVEHKQQMKTIKEETKAAIESAVLANDFNAFTTARDAVHTQMEALRPADAPERKEHPEFSDEEQQEKFTKLVDYYTENGELPARAHGKRGFGKKGFGKRGGHGDCTK